MNLCWGTLYQGLRIPTLHRAALQTLQLHKHSYLPIVEAIVSWPGKKQYLNEMHEMTSISRHYLPLNRQVPALDVYSHLNCSK